MSLHKWINSSKLYYIDEKNKKIKNLKVNENREEAKELKNI